MTRNQSVTRLKISPPQPRKCPAAIPMTVPRSTEIAVLAKPTSKDTRAPQMSSVSTERPLSSVPSQ